MLLIDSDTKENAVYIYSFRGIWHLLTSGIVIYHHGPLAGLIPLTSFRRLNYHINHGIHFKKVELALDPHSEELKNHKSFVKTKWFCKHHAVSSHVDALACCAYYHVLHSNIHVTGIPRNDIFFNENKNELPNYINDDIKKISEIALRKKIIVYAPTWRSSGGAYTLTLDDENLLAIFLRENQAVFFYAGHPYLKNRIIPNIDGVYDFNIMFTDIQPLLKYADVLITDYSSIWIDFLLTKKPIVGFHYDYKFYKDDRGFLYDFSSVFPGPIVSDFNTLLLELKNLLSGDFTVNNKYNISLSIFHEHFDGQNCRRITDSIIKESR